MANEKISAMPAASALDGAELVPLVQSGGNVRATAQDVANLGFLQTVTVPISALELATLYSAPVQIIAGVAGKIINIVSYLYQYKAGIASPTALTSNGLLLSWSADPKDVIWQSSDGGLNAEYLNGYGAVAAPNPPTNPTGASIFLLNYGIDLGIWGAITGISVTAGNAGLLYAIGDLFTIPGGSGDAVGIVTGVGAGGAVTSVAVTGAGTNPGTSYTTVTGNATVPNSPSLGDGNLQVDLVVSTPQTGTAQVDVAYYLVNAPT